ncbi:hypothetical protein AAC387_Pa01g0986 [Persea americana]
MLLAGKTSIQKTHYDILSIKEDSGHDEIRASYRAAVLDTHPDKLQGRFEVFERCQDLQERFLLVQKAWEILGDPKSRAIYDNELQALRQDSEIADDVKMEEMTVEDDGDVVELFYQCRCGDYFSINSVELTEMGFSFNGQGRKISWTIDSTLASVVLPCGSCSLKIRLVIDMSDSAQVPLSATLRHRRSFSYPAHPLCFRL